jgi:hypothetical protein
MGSDLRLTSPWDGSSPGTRFHFDVVLEAVADVPRTSSQRALDARAEGERDDDVATALPRTLRCLVADDLAFNRNLLSRYLTRMPPFDALRWAAKESDMPNFKGSYLGRVPLVSADFWTSDHLSERSRRVGAFSGTRTRGTLTLKRR